MVIDDSIMLPSFVSEDFFDRPLRVVTELLDDPRLQGDLCVRLCSVETSQALNKMYRNSDKATNVLSFTADIETPEGKLLGDLAICWHVVEDEAKAQNKSSCAHLLHMYVHGLLHLLGFDHKSTKQAHSMESLEVSILEAMNISNPYVPCN